MIRGVLVIIWTILSAVTHGTAAILASVFSRDAGAFFAKLWCRNVLQAAGVRVSVTGTGNLRPDRRYVFVANHQSAIDIPVVYCGLPCRTSFVAKKELFMLPFFGWGIAAIGHIAIDRSNARKARVSIQRGIDHLRKTNSSLIIFPEGTRSADGTVQEFKKAAFGLAIEAGAEIVPVAITGVRQVLPKKAVLVRPGTVRIRVGEPIAVDGSGSADKALFAARVRGEIKRMVETPER